MSERQMRFRIGLFVLTAMVLLGALVVMFGAFPTLFKRGHVYTIVFTDAPGVLPGTPVRRSGVRVGEVRNLTLDENTGQVRVVASIEPPYQVRRNEVPTLVTGLLGTDVSIDFIPLPEVEGQPPPDRAPVPPDTVLAGALATTVGTLISRASEVVPTTQETLNDMRKSLQRLEKMSPMAEETMREFRDLARTTRELAPNVRRTTNEIGELAKSARQAVPDARRTLDDVGAASRSVTRLGERVDTLLQANQDKLVKAVDNLNEVAQRTADLLNEENRKNVTATIRNTRRASDRFESIAQNVDDAAKEGRETMKEARDAVKEGRQAGERLNKLLKQVEEILQNLQTASRPIAERGPNIVRNADEALDKLNRTLSDASALFKVLDQSDGVFRRFLTDPTLYNRLDDILCSVQRSMPRLERILKDAETFVDKLARHPEALGLGGVVRPGTGLKEPPTPPGAFRGPR